MPIVYVTFVEYFSKTKKWCIFNIFIKYTQHNLDNIVVAYFHFYTFVADLIVQEARYQVNVLYGANISVTFLAVFAMYILKPN